MIAHGGVPHAYQGLWQRKYLESASGIDTSTRVCWLQTSVLHADIRIPADRPAFVNKTGLTDFSMPELRLLASQQGFAGTTCVTTDTCQWLRQIDYQPAQNVRDIGHMQFDGQYLLETGIEQDYTEIWEHMPDSRGATQAYRFTQENVSQGGQAQSGILVISGDYFIFVRDRIRLLPPAVSLDALARQVTKHQQLVELLDMEISFGRVRGGDIPWEIQLSTLPFRETQPLFTQPDSLALSQAQQVWLQRELAWNGTIDRYWLKING